MRGIKVGIHVDVVELAGLLRKCSAGSGDVSKLPAAETTVVGNKVGSIFSSKLCRELVITASNALVVVVALQ